MGMVALLVVLVAVVTLYAYYYSRWKHLWTLESPCPPYTVAAVTDDSLRVVMIGDSWVGMRRQYDVDSMLASQLSRLCGCKATVTSCGRGGEKTRGIYHLMFNSGDYGTRPLLSAGAHYCVIVAGINDAAACLGTRQYVYYYRQIIDFLVGNRIRPVIVEIPDVDIWHLYGSKPAYNLLSDFVKSTMSGCRMYSYRGYREALRRMLDDEQLAGKVVLVGMEDWNDGSPAIDEKLFLSDRIHLNHQGYQRLDASIARAIAADVSR